MPAGTAWWPSRNHRGRAGGPGSRYRRTAAGHEPARRRSRQDGSGAIARTGPTTRSTFWPPRRPPRSRSAAVARSSAPPEGKSGNSRCERRPGCRFGSVRRSRNVDRANLAARRRNDAGLDERRLAAARGAVQEPDGKCARGSRSSMRRFHARTSSGTPSRSRGPGISFEKKSASSMFETRGGLWGRSRDRGIGAGEFTRRRRLGERVGGRLGGSHALSRRRSQPRSRSDRPSAWRGTSGRFAPARGGSGH